jgi:hypothetical protein
MRRFSTLAALLAVAVAAPHSTAQVTLDFDNLGSANFQTFPSVTEDGFTLTPGGAGVNDVFGMHGSSQTDYPGSPALFHQTGGMTITLTQVGGDPFNLTSMQVSELRNSGTQSVPLNFTGNKATGGTVSANFTLDGTFGFQTLTFSEFTNLSSVSWVQQSQFHQFDTIVVAPVPEPATVLGFAAACGGALGLIRRYRRRHSSPADSSSGPAGDFMTSRSSTVA